MKPIFGGTFYLVAGALVGLVSAVMAVDRFGAAPVQAESAWSSWASTGDSTLSYYAVAHYLLAGRLPPAPSQALEMTADQDSEGQSLDSSCTYVVSGKPSDVLWWSLGTGTVGATSTRVDGLIDSGAAVAESDGVVRVTVSASPRPGNWIKPPTDKKFLLLFTAATLSSVDRKVPPPQLQIARSDC